MMSGSSHSVSEYSSFFEIRGLRIAHKGSLMKVSTDSRLLTAFAAQFEYISVLDIGCGIGTISLLLAVHNNSSFVTAIDVDKEAVDVIRFNIQFNGLENLVAVHVDAKDYYSERKFDLIVSNPPYFTRQLTSNNIRRMRFRHSSDDFPDSVAALCSRQLSNLGVVCFVLFPGTEPAWSYCMAKKGLVLIKYFEVKNKESSPASCILVAYSLTRNVLKSGQIIMADENGVPLDAFTQWLIGF